MRIMICIASMESGGAERQVTYLAKGLVELGHEVHVVLINRGANYDRLLESGTSIHMVNIYPNSFRFVLPLVRLFRKVKPDVVYLWQRPFDVLGGIAALFAGIPAVHAERTDPAKVKPGLKVWLRNAVLPWSKAVIANSEAGAAYWHQRIKGVRIAKIPNIILHEEMQHVQPSVESKGYIVAIGRLDANKNVITLLRAVKLLNQKGIQFNVLVVGDGEDSNKLKRFVEDQEMSNQIRFVGYRNDAWSLLKGSKGFVSLSLYEGEPNVVLEAAALGCRLILSDIPAHRSLKGLSNMMFVNPDSELEVGNALESLQLEERDDTATDNPVSYLSSEWTIRSSASVCRVHLEVFSQALAK